MVQILGREFDVDVERIVLKGESVQGTFPTEVGLLTKATYLEIGKTQISGSIPTELGNLTALQHLIIYESPLNGSLPLELFELEALTRLWLIKTQVEGPLPRRLGNLRELTSLIIRSNPLGGEIPEELGRLINLEQCILNGNGLNGTLPSAIGELSKLSSLDLNNNRLHGLLPSELGLLDKLEQFQGQINGFTGEIPAQLLSLPLLKSLYLDNNQLEGFPREIEASQSLQSLRLHVNPLRGALPNGFGSFSELTSLVLRNNELTSTLPAEFANLLKLKRLEIQGNEFIGQFPDLQRMESLTLMKAQQNQFTGSFPKLPLSIQRLDLSDNRLHSDIAAVSRLQAIVELRIALNQFTGALSPLETLTKLRTLDAHHNAFNGSFPFLPGTARTIDLNSNKLSGELSADMFSALQRLNTLSIGNNRFTSLENFALPISVRKLELQDNQLEGSIPKEIFDLARLTVLDISENAWDPTSLTPNITRLAALRRLSIGVDVVCDCKLLSWYTPFVNEVSRIDNKGEIARCSEANSFGGTHPHLLTVDEEAPCTHATLVSIVSSARSLNLTWSYDDDRLGSYLSRDKSILEILEPADRLLFAAGAHLNSADDGLDGAFAFELEWSDSTSSSGFSRRFVDAKVSKQSAEDPKLFAEDLRGLLPNSAYNLRIRPLRLLQQGSLPVAYVYGPGSSVPTQTREDLPSGGVVNVRAVDSEATRVRLTWDVPDESQLNGRIVQYRLEVWDGQVSRLVESESKAATIVNLSPDRGYLVRVQPGTTKGFSGVWSQYTNITTCPPLSRWSNESSISGECEAIEGHYRDEFSNFKSCAELTRDFSDALQNECNHAGVDVRSLPLGKGYWRASLGTSSFHPCPDPSWCTGSVDGIVNSVDNYCVDNHSGVFCFSCVEGLVPSPQGCIVCTPQDETEANTTVALYSLLYLLILGFYVGKMLIYSRVLRACVSRRKRRQRSRQRRPLSSRNRLLKSAASSFTRLNRSSVKDSVRNYNTAKVRILFGFLQVYFAFRRNFIASKRDNTTVVVTLEFLSSSSFALVLDSFAVRCGFDLTPYSILLLTTLLPVVFVVLLVAIRNALMRKFIQLATPVKREFTWAVLSFLFLIYPSVSRTVLETFWCTQVAGMEHPVLNVDYHTTCDATSERIAWVVYAAFMVIVYPIGVVVLYAALLYYYVGIIRKRKEDQSEDEVQRLAKISFLIAPYKSSTYWFETYELLRKLLQTSLIGFLLPWVPPESLNVVAVVSQNLCMVAIGVLLYTQPYRHKSDLVFALLSLALLLLDTQFSVVDPYEPADTVFTLYAELAIFLVFSSMDLFISLRYRSVFSSSQPMTGSPRIQAGENGFSEGQTVRTEVRSDEKERKEAAQEESKSPSSIATSQSARTTQGREDYRSKP